MARDEFDYRLGKRDLKGKALPAALDRGNVGPKEAGESEMTTLPFNFGAALERLKNGEKVARKGWKGKGMYLWLEKGSHDFGNESVQSYIGGVRSSLFENGDRGTSTRMPHLCMRAADGSTVTGWLASQTDLLAIDWVAV
jgi:hypothetical protein